MYLLCLKRKDAQTLKKKGPGKNFLPNAYVIDTTCFIECFTLCYNWEHHFS